MSNFNMLLEQFAQNGNRYNLIPRLTASAKGSGMSVEELLDACHGAGVRNRDLDLRRMFTASHAEPNRRRDGWRGLRRTRPAEPPPPTQEERDFVPRTLRGLGIGATSRDIRAMSPFHLDGQTTPWTECARQLLAMDCGFPVWCGTILNPDFAAARGLAVKRGEVRDPFELAADISAKTGAWSSVLNLPSHVSIEPQTGLAVQLPNAHGGGTHPSFDCAGTIAAWPFALLEFDALDLGAQCEIVAGMIRHPEIEVVCAVFSGGRSIHTVIRLTEAHDYKTSARRLVRLFCSADEPRFRADCQPILSPTSHVRLAGGVRPETGRRQRLLYCATADGREP